MPSSTSRGYLIKASVVLLLTATALVVFSLYSTSDDVIPSEYIESQHWNSICHVQRPDFLKMKKVVVFSLYGDRVMDRDGALANAISVPLYYPSWNSVFVVDDSIPRDFQNRLWKAGGSVIQVPSNYSSWGDAKRILRYLVLGDMTIEYAMFRDADSRISAREISSVNAWLQTNKTFHIMRDHPNHLAVILGGMWSVHAATLRSKLGNIRDNVINYVQNQTPDRGTDQKWLSEVIWPLVGDDVVVHDSFNCDKIDHHAMPFPLPRDYYVDYVGLVQDTSDTETPLHGHMAVWEEYMRHGEATFQSRAPENCRLQPHHIYG